MAPRDVPAVGGEHLGVGGDIGVGELGPTPHNRHDDAARRHWVEVPNLRDTFGEVGVEHLEERPPHPRPQVALALPTPGELTIPGLIFTPRGVEKQLKSFATTFSSQLPHAFITLFHRTSQSRASTSPQSTM